MVEVLGYGGGGGDDETPDNKQQHRCDSGSNYNPNSGFRVIGNGQLTDERQNMLTGREKEALVKLTEQRR